MLGEFSGEFYPVTVRRELLGQSLAWRSVENVYPVIGGRPESRGFGDSLLCSADKGFGVELKERPQRTKVATGLLEEQRVEFSLLSGEGERMLALQNAFDKVRLPGILKQRFGSSREFSPQPGADVGDRDRVRTLRRE